MSPQQLLKETQRAAGDPNLEAWHQTLIEAGKSLKDEQIARPIICYAGVAHFSGRNSKLIKTSYNSIKTAMKH
jgi:hypothetical protein